MLAEAGFHVVRFDNRDTGRSTRLKGRVTRGQLVQSFLGRGGRPPYTLNDMAADAFGLMDHLGWDSAHVAGVSMGGMIVQTMAIDQPRRVRSLTSIMSTLGKRSVGWQHPSLLPMLLAHARRRPGGLRRHSAKMWQVIGSPGFPQTDEQVRARAEETFDRGVSRQRRDAPDAGDPQPAQPLACAGRAADPRSGGARLRRQDGARLRWPRHRAGDPRGRAAGHRRDGPRHAGRASSRPSPTSSVVRRTGPACPRSRASRPEPTDPTPGSLRR